MFPFVEAATSDARLGCVAGGAAVGCLCRAAADVDGGASARNVFIPRPLPRAFEFFVGVGTGGARGLGARFLGVGERASRPVERRHARRVHVP